MLQTDNRPSFPDFVAGVLARLFPPVLAKLSVDLEDCASSENWIARDRRAVALDLNVVDLGAGKAVLVVVAVLLFGSGLFAQQHAPTVDVCRADAAVWRGALSKDALSRLSAQEVFNRNQEITQCILVDPPPYPTVKGEIMFETYLLLRSSYAEELANRYIAFIHRHNLSDQFLAEDAAGKRGNQ
jgi:hypothetical protein